MNAVALRCPHCERPLYLFFFEDGRKSLGCRTCIRDPVVTHKDLNKVFDKWLEISIVGRAS